ncbi:MULTISPECIES: putative sensor domain DACNV-containing protein [Sorangium]|uniref:putative sensor domain DACNV-containing protein n=1 Tax=Sorangium TaxID=39643 RepID=UPI00101A4356|nr:MULTISPECIES: hypothetical protein [Sorangium]
MNVTYPVDVARALARELGDAAPPQLERLVEVLFFASLLREEGHDLTFNVVYPGVFDPTHPTPERVHGWEPWDVVDFETPDEFTSEKVAKYAPLAQGDDEYLIVHCATDQLLIAGVGHKKMGWPGDKLLTVRVVGAGALRFFYRSGEIASYAGGKNEPLVSWHSMYSEPALNDIVEAMDNMGEVVDDKRALASAALKMLISDVVRRRHGGIIAI